MRTALLLSLLAFHLVACSQAGMTRPTPEEQDTLYTYRSPTTDGIGKYYTGREIARVIGPGGAGWLERSGREEEEHSDQAVDSMRLRLGDVVADIGAGTGYYSRKVASRVPQGKVFAVELQQELRDHLHRKNKETGATNIEVVAGDTLSVNLPDASVDFAFMVDVYHELAWPVEVMQSIHRCLRPDGRLMLMEYRGEDPEVPIKPLHKMTKDQVVKEMRAAGFVLDRSVDVLPIQHFLVFRKSDR